MSSSGSDVVVVLKLRDPEGLVKNIGTGWPGGSVG